ncbi:DUF6236 family protein [Cereibacter sphaeroides]|nr:DUF6236 family protein [Cereibacter sphaeroides]
MDFDVGEIGRGIIMSNPLNISGSSVSVASPNLDPGELRRALLFWDLIAWPSTNGIHFAGGPDEDFLMSESRLVRPKFRVRGDAAKALPMAFIETLKTVERRRPGQWMMSSGERCLALSGKDIINDRGVLTTLSNAIPVPMHDMPLEDVLRFKDRRLPEVLALRGELDGFYQNWINSEDQDHQLRMAVRAIDRASADMIRVARESKNPFLLSSWKVSFSISPVDSLKFFLGGKVLGLDMASSLLIGAASTISISRDVGLKSSKGNSPYSYIASIHTDLM